VQTLSRGCVQTPVDVSTNATAVGRRGSRHATWAAAKLRVRPSIAIEHSGARWCRHQQRSVVLDPTDTGLFDALAPMAIAAKAELIDSTCVRVLVNRTHAEMTMVATHASSPLLMLLSGISKSVSLTKERFAVES